VSYIITPGSENAPVFAKSVIKTPFFVTLNVRHVGRGYIGIAIYHVL